MRVEDDAAVFADDDDGAVDTVFLRSQRVVGAGDVETLVDEEVEGELLFLDELAMAGEASIASRTAAS